MLKVLLDNEDKLSDTSVCIRKPSTTVIHYGDRIMLHTDIESELPKDYSVKWTASNDNFALVESDNGTVCTITPAKSGDTVFTATFFDADGNEISSDEQTMTSKAFFFWKIIAFFKKLFRLVKIMPEAITEI